MTTAPAVQIDMSKAMAELDRFHKLLGDESRDGVKTMARDIALSASTATKQAPKYRPIVKRNPLEPELNDDDTMWAKGVTKGRVYYISIKADNKQEARTSRKAAIIRRGLSKSAWLWVYGAIAGGSKSNNSAGPGVRKDSRYFDVLKRSTSQEEAMRLHNKLDYASLAFKTKGRATVDNIGERAAGRFRYRMRKKIERAEATQ